MMQRRLLGEKHSKVAEGLHNLATLLQRQGRHAESESLFSQTIDLRRELHGERHPDDASTLTELGALLHEQGKYAEAETVFRDAHAMQQELFGDEHPKTCSSLGALAAALLATEWRRIQAGEVATRKDILFDALSIGAVVATIALVVYFF